MTAVLADVDAERRLSQLGRGSDGSVERLLLALEDALGTRPIGRAFVQEFRTCWDLLTDAWSGVPSGAREARRELAFVTLSRILFLSFVQARGWLDGRRRFLSEELARAVEGGQSAYASFLCTLFFNVLNTPRTQRDAQAQSLGAVPFLNGGLFAEHPLEARFPERDLPNDLVLVVFERLFERYVFCASEAELEGGGLSPTVEGVIDPEMLGHVFEALMAQEERASSGSFYTPRRVVRRVVRDALVAYAHGYLEKTRGAWVDSSKRPHNGQLRRGLERLLEDGDATWLSEDDAFLLERALAGCRVLDPAAGSGAFVLGAFEALVEARRTLAKRLGRAVSMDEVRRQVATQNVFAVDLLPMAIRLCELRLWLALSVGLEVGDVEEVPPLPNLDLSLRQGDALLEAHDLDSVVAVRTLDSAGFEKELGALRDLKLAYQNTAGSEKAKLARAIELSERRTFALLVQNAQDVLSGRLDALRRLEEAPDLFGRARGLGHDELRLRRELEGRRTELEAVGRQLETQGHPYFAFGLHFCEVVREGGFDVVVGNPPWVRPHRLRGALKRRLRARYQVFHASAWRGGARVGRGLRAGQVDLAAVFVERALGLVRPGGIVGFLVPNKLSVAMGAGGFRKLVASKAELLGVVDWANAPEPLFGATTYPALLLMRRRGEASSAKPGAVQVERVLATGRSQTFVVPSERLQLVPGDAASPWVLEPSSGVHLLEQMREAGRPLGERFSLRRGVVTGCNGVFVPESVVRSPGSGHVLARFGSGAEWSLETGVLRPSLRGCDVAPFAVQPSRSLVFPHGEDGAVLEALPAGLGTYLATQRETLEQRRDLRPGMPCWTLFRVHSDMFRPKVVWRDIARRLEAAFVSGAEAGAGTPIPLNTVYYAAVSCEEEGYLLSALLNSTPVRRFTAAIAEPARGDYRRYFSWVVGMVPWPFDAVSPVLTTRLSQASRRLHGHRGSLAASEQASLLALVDELVEEAYQSASTEAR